MFMPPSSTEGGGEDLLLSGMGYQIGRMRYHIGGCHTRYWMGVPDKGWVPDRGMGYQIRGQVPKGIGYQMEMGTRCKSPPLPHLVPIPIWPPPPLLAPIYFST